MAVNGIEIKVGQVWRQRDGRHVCVVKPWGDGWETGTAFLCPNMAFITENGRQEGDQREYDLVELIRDEDGFTPWHGGEQPVETKGKRVLYRMIDRDSAEAEADDLTWTHGTPGVYDIVAYKVLETVAVRRNDDVEHITTDAAALAAEMLSDLGYRWDGQCWAQELPPAAPPAPADRREYTGGSVSYYSVEVAHPTTEGRTPYIAECNDLIEALQMNYAEANVLKALWRICAARRGLSKRGYTDGVYDAEKINFFGARVLVQQRKEGGAA